MTGDFAGTYFYMSPEQVTAKRIGLDHRSDRGIAGARSLCRPCASGHAERGDEDPGRVSRATPGRTDALSRFVPRHAGRACHGGARTHSDEVLAKGGTGGLQGPHHLFVAIRERDLDRLVDGLDGEK